MEKKRNIDSETDMMNCGAVKNMLSTLKKIFKGEYVTLLVAIGTSIISFFKYMSSFFVAGRLYIYNVNVVHIPFFNSFFCWFIIIGFILVLGYCTYLAFLHAWRKKRNILQLLRSFIIGFFLYVFGLVIVIHMCEIVPIWDCLQYAWKNYLTIMALSLFFFLSFIFFGYSIHSVGEIVLKRVQKRIRICLCVSIVLISALASCLFECGKIYEKERTDFNVIEYNSEEFAVAYELKDSLIIVPVSYSSINGKVYRTVTRGDYCITDSRDKRQNKMYFLSLKEYENMFKKRTNEMRVANQ